MTEHQLRKALSAVDELEPPADELFAQRSLQRGRARMGRRRKAVLGAAAGVALVGVLGGTWLTNQTLRETTSMSAGSADGSAEDAGGGRESTAQPTVPVEAPGRPGVLATHESGWVQGTVTPQTAALEEIVGTLALTYPDVFGGAYATDPSNTRIVVTVTKPDPELEALVRSLMPEPGDVSFEVVTHTALRKQEVAANVAADASQWLEKGVTIVGVRLDGRADRVVVTVREPESVEVVEQRYGPDIVRAEVGAGPPLGGTVTDPSDPTMPTPED